MHTQTGEPSLRKRSKHCKEKESDLIEASFEGKVLANEPKGQPMKFVRSNQCKSVPDVSFVLLDWGCRESFHTLEYLSNQKTPRDRYEVIWIEYYDRQPSELTKLVTNYEKREGLDSPIDTWIIMARPAGEVFRKHWMNNLGILHSKGRIVCFIDSDAITRPTLVDTIIKEFESNSDICLYIEEIRTADKSFYPFTYPSPKEIISSAVNMTGGVPNAMRNFRSGLLGDSSLIHWRNYGACFCALREDLIRIGGWDEHDDYTGYIAGPYEMSLRMELTGMREVWSFFEPIYHVPHPGNDGIGNFSGPHDGRGVSTTAMKVIKTKRTMPLVENPEIRALRSKLPKKATTPNSTVTSPPNQPSHELKPTTPEKCTFVFLPPCSSTTWDKRGFFISAQLYDEFETKFLGDEYSRSYAIASYAAVLAKTLNLPQERVEAIYVAGLVCNVENILQVLESTLGAGTNKDNSTLIDNFFSHWSEEPFTTIRKIIRVYREHFDGSGPKGLKGNQIPVEAGIVALAHHFDCMINMRTTKNGMPFYKVCDSIIQKSGKVFDPVVVDAFVKCQEDFVCINLKNQNNTLDFMYPCYRFEKEHINRNSMSYNTDRAIRLQETWCEFNIYVLNNHNSELFYAIPAWEDSCDLIDLRQNRYKYFFAGHDLNKVKRYITPELVLANFYGHNVIRCAGEYFALKNPEGPFSLARCITNAYDSYCYSDTNLHRLKKRLFIAALRNVIERSMKKLVEKLVPNQVK